MHDCTGHEPVRVALCHRVAGPPKLLEATLLGLQAVRSKYGAESRQASAAAAMLQGTLAEVWAALHDATGRPPPLAKPTCISIGCMSGWSLHMT